MKKFLFGTTALVAAAAFAGAASAKDLKISVGGAMTVGLAAGSFNGVDEGATDANDNFFILRDGEIRWTAKGTLDNGITITARVEIEAFGAGESDVVDENWVDIETAFGTLLIGGNDDAAYNVGGIGIATAYLGHSANDETYNFTPATVDTLGGVDSLAVHYYTPNIAGFEAGISYTNDVSSDGDGFGGSNMGDDDSITTDNDDDLVSIGANYQNSFGDFDFAIGGGYIYTEIGDTIERNEWGVGAEIGFAGFSFKARYEQEEGDGNEVADPDRWFVSGGINYKTGPWNFGIAGVFEEQDNEGFGGATDDQTQYRILGGVNYTLGDGVTVGAGVEYGSVESVGGDPSNDEDGFAGALLLGVSF